MGQVKTDECQSCENVFPETELVNGLCMNCQIDDAIELAERVDEESKYVPCQLCGVETHPEDLDPDGICYECNDEQAEEEERFRNDQEIQMEQEDT